MSTPFTDIYSIFLKDITDKKLVNMLTPEELGDILEDYLMESISIHFKQCKKDLSNIITEETNTGDVDENGMPIIEIAKSFADDLTHEEKVIIAKGMKLKWLSSNFIANESKLVMRLTTKDYKVFSPANHLKILLEIDRDTRKEIRSLVMSYLYNHLIRG